MDISFYRGGELFYPTTALKNNVAGKLDIITLTSRNQRLKFNFLNYVKIFIYHIKVVSLMKSCRLRNETENFERVLLLEHNNVTIY